MLRNAAIALGNRPTPRAIPALIRGLNDDEPIVRGACAWALGKYDRPEGHEGLTARMAIENDAEVLSEIESALNAQPVAIDVAANERTQSGLQ